MKSGIIDGCLHYTDFVVKNKNGIVSMSGEEIIDHYKLKLNKWNDVSDMKVVGLYNSWVDIDSVYIRGIKESDKVCSIILDGHRRVDTTGMYPCVVMNSSRTFTCIKPALSLNTKIDNIPVGTTLRACMPFTLKKGMASMMKIFLDSEKESFEYRDYFSLMKLNNLKIGNASDNVVMRFKVNNKYRPYIQTSSGILLYS